jgi:hypothetical protein
MSGDRNCVPRFHVNNFTVIRRQRGSISAAAADAQPTASPGHSSSTGSDALCPAYRPAVVPPKIARVSFPVQPVKAVTSAQLPVGKPGEWSYEPKFDGFIN